METIDLESLPPDQWQKNLVTFRGADGGDEQITDGFRAAGSLEEWVRTVHRVADYPRVLLAVYGSLAPVGWAGVAGDVSKKRNFSLGFNNLYHYFK